MKRIVICLGLLITTASARGDELLTLDHALVRQGPKLVAELKKRGCTNVGVLKFLAARAGDDKFSDNVGTLNIELARRLELALILGNDAKEPIGIIENANAVAVRTRGANHLSKEGRLALFDAKFPLAWGAEQVAADGFVTGTVEIAKDLRTLNIHFDLVEKKSNQVVPLGQAITVLNQVGRLVELSESFVRGDGVVAAGKERTKIEDETLQGAVAVQNGKAVHPLENPQAPVALDVYYDDQPVRITVKDGRARISEPKEGQKVGFMIRRLDRSDTTYAVVLKVNGENVLFRQRLPDVECRCYVLYANSEPVYVPGYQKTDGAAEQFVVLSRAESKAKEINYGADVGMFTMTVFREFKGRPSVDVHDEMAEVAVLQQMPAPATRAKKASELRAKLIEDANRGLLDAGADVKSEIRRVKFVKDPTPVMCVAVQYYKP